MTPPLPVRLARLLSATILGFLVVAVFVNVVLRFVFNSGFVVTEEISRILLVWLVFGGAIAVLHGGQHISMTMAVEKLGRAGQIALALLGAALMIFCDALLLIGAWRQLGFSLSDSFPVSGLPVAVIYAPGVIAALAFMAITLWQVTRLLTGRIGPEDYFGINAPDPELH
ncbi:MAG: TRAP transporter small permease subunit [Paracoccaceae bacterium]